ncbi:MAG: hypothetical protein II998_02580 [Clostridia bacterium]|nr:hypothetical protein [Clostridia bacterium]
MNIIEKAQNFNVKEAIKSIPGEMKVYSDKALDKIKSLNVKETIKSIPGEVKVYSDIAVDKIKNMSKTDVAIFGAITACIGSIVGCIFSKSFKKILALLSVACGLGSAYLIYKKLLKDE